MRAYFFRLQSGGKAARKFVTQEAYNIKLFRTSINNSIEIANGESQGIWQFKLIRFFAVNQQHAIACAFTTDSYEGQPENARDVMGHAFTGFDFDFSISSRFIWINKKTPDFFKQISKFLRDSETLSENDFKDLNKLRVVADARGIGVVDSGSEFTDLEQRGQNLLIIVALTCAYQAALNDASNELSNIASYDQKLSERKYREWVSFLSANYFREPVKASTVESFHFYEFIRERQHIQSQFSEVTEQLKLLADLAQLDRAEEAKKQVAAANWKMTLIGIVIAAFSLIFTFLQVTQVAPKSINDTLVAWQKCWQHSWAICSGMEEKVSQPPSKAASAQKIPTANKSSK